MVVARRSFVAPLPVLLLLPSILPAQTVSSTTGAMNGKVTDKTNSVLPWCDRHLEQRVVDGNAHRRHSRTRSRTRATTRARRFSAR